MSWRRTSGSRICSCLGERRGERRMPIFLGVNATWLRIPLHGSTWVICSKPVRCAISQYIQWVVSKKTNIYIYIPWNQTWKSQAASLRSSPSLNTLVLQSQRWVNESKLGTMGARWSWMAWVPGSGRERSASIPEGERGSHETTAFGFSCRPFLVVARSN